MITNAEMVWLLTQQTHIADQAMLDAEYDFERKLLAIARAVMDTADLDGEMDLAVTASQLEDLLTGKLGGFCQEQFVLLRDEWYGTLIEGLTSGQA